MIIERVKFAAPGQVAGKNWKNPCPEPVDNLFCDSRFGFNFDSRDLESALTEVHPIKSTNLR